MESITLRIGHFFGTMLPQALQFVRESRRTEVITMSPLMRGVILQLLVIIFIIFLVRVLRRTKVGVAFTLLFDSMYEFFEEIIGEQEKRFIKIYIVTLFFVVLLSNMISYVIDIIRVAFVDIEAIFEYIAIPTTNFNFNLALAAVSVVLMLIIQFKQLRFFKFLHEYFPIMGKNIITVDRGNMPAIAYYPLRVFVKLIDIGISLFVGFLDIIGIGAKILSLTARLYGNMLAGGILLGLLVVGLNSLTQNIAGSQFPVLGPLVLYAQGLLVAVIQAFVFPLLVAIFIKIAQGND